jgi:hypothetical protein
MHSRPMATLTMSAVRLAVAVAALTTLSFAQNQDANDAHAQFGRQCDVSWLFTPYDVGRDFSVKLSYHQAPLPRIRVVLEANDYGKASVTAMTDSSGTAHFLAVPPGKYSAGAKNGLQFPSNEVTVHADGDFDSEIEIEWPVVPLPVRSFRGRLLAPGEGDEPDRPLRFATVNLVDLRSSRVVETQRTIEDGSYEFATVEPGLYVVRVIPPAKDKKTMELSGDLAVELDAAAKEPTIPELKVLQSECATVQLLRRDASGNR